MIDMNSKPLLSFQEGRRTLDFGQFKVVEESKNFYGIYLVKESNRLITHRPSWRSATKVAQLLQLAYYAGYEAGKENYRWWAFER